jgi:hypothetical protein
VLKCEESIVVEKREKHYVRDQHFKPLVLSVAINIFFSQCKSDYLIIVVPSCVNCSISTPLLSQKTDAINFLADIACLNVFGLFGECMCFH